VPRERARRPLAEAYAGKQFVGIDLHRRRTVIVRSTAAGEVLEAVRIVNDVQRLASVMARAGQCPEVVLEATYGWYWAVDAFQAGGANVHLAHPLGVSPGRPSTGAVTRSVPPMGRAAPGGPTARYRPGRTDHSSAPGPRTWPARRAPRLCSGNVARPAWPCAGPAHAAPGWAGARSTPRVGEACVLHQRPTRFTSQVRRVDPIGVDLADTVLERSSFGIARPSQGK
jgi:hypothetical protein